MNDSPDPKYDPRKRWQTCIVCREDFYSQRIDAMTCGPTCRKALSRWQKKTGRKWRWGDIIPRGKSCIKKSQILPPPGHT